MDKLNYWMEKWPRISISVDHKFETNEASCSLKQRIRQAQTGLDRLRSQKDGHRIDNAFESSFDLAKNIIGRVARKSFINIFLVR